VSAKVELHLGELFPRVGFIVTTLNLGNLLRRLVLPLALQSWSLTRLQQRLLKTGWRLIRHTRYFVLLLAESYLTRPLFRQIVVRIERLAWRTRRRGRPSSRRLLPDSAQRRVSGNMRRRNQSRHCAPVMPQK
jgi:hypothetical protein